jgi:hypothetical protein
MTATSAPASTRGRFGLPSASALVVGSVIGTGVFALPLALAGVRADLAGRLWARHRGRDRPGPHLPLTERPAPGLRRPVCVRAGRELGRRVFDRYGLRGAEVTDDVFTSPACDVFQQAENRMHTIKAVIVSSLGGRDDH